MRLGRAVLLTLLLHLGPTGCGLGDVGADLDAWKAAHAVDAQDEILQDVAADAPQDVPDDLATVDAPDAPSDSQDAAVDVPPACTPGSCDDGNLCTDDSCAPSQGCVHTPAAAPCDDGSSCTGPDVCQGGSCHGPQRTWMHAFDQAATPERIVAVRTLAQGRTLTIAQVRTPPGDLATERPHLQVLDAAGQVETEALGDPGLRWTAIVPLPTSTLLLGVRKTADGLQVATAMLPLDAVQPASVATLTDAPDQVVAGEVQPDGSVLVLALAPDQSANRVVLRHLDASGGALGRTVVAGTLVSSLAGWAPHPFGGHVIAGVTPKAQAWVAHVDAAGKRQGDPHFLSWPGATKHQVAGVLPLGSGFLLVGTCQLETQTRRWLVRLDRDGAEVSSQIGDGPQDALAAVQPVDSATFLAVGSSAGTPSNQPTLWKLATTGQVVWTRVLPGAGTGLALAADADGTVAIGGVHADGSLEHAWAARTNPWGLIDCAGAGSCAGGSDACDDGNPCSLDACTLGGACTSTDAALPCQDGDTCTRDDTCMGGTCHAGPTDTCEDGLVCTQDACTPQVGCTFANLSVPCDDSDACTLSDECTGSTCAGPVAVGCNDGNPCTVDSCDPGSGCVALTGPDGDGCGPFVNNIPQVCATGQCIQPWSTLVAGGPDYSCSFHGAKPSCWGANDHGQLGNGDGPPSGTPVPVPVSAYTMATGDGFACIAGGYDVTCWGRNDVGQLGVVPGPVALTETTTEFDGSVIGLAAGTAHVCVLSGKGKVYCRGSNAWKQLGHAGAPSGPVWVDTLGLPPIKTIVAGGNQTCAVATTGETLCWGQAKVGSYELGATDVPQLIALPGPPNQLAVGGTFACAQFQDGTVQCWGRNDYGQLGIGAAADITLPPQPIKGVKDAWSVTAGANHACVVRPPGQVWCWGSNLQGQLGTASKVAVGQIVPPVLAVTLPTIDVVAAGTHTCLRTLVGTVYCWGAGGLPGLVPQSADPVVLSESQP